MTTRRERSARTGRTRFARSLFSGFIGILAVIAAGVAGPAGVAAAGDDAAGDGLAPIADGVLRKAAARRYEASELALADGREAGAPILLAVRGIVFDVSEGRRFYGEGGRYRALAGRDATCALTKMSMKPEDLEGRCAIVAESEKAMLSKAFEETFVAKYPVVGHVAGGAFFPKGLCCPSAQCGPC